MWIEGAGFGAKAEGDGGDGVHCVTIFHSAEHGVTAEHHHIMCQRHRTKLSGVTELCRRCWRLVSLRAWELAMATGAMAAMAAPTGVKVAVAQMTAVSNVEANFVTCARLVQEAVEGGVKLLSLPECFSFIGSKEGETLKIAEPLTGPIIKRYQSLAREAGLWLSLGGFQEKGPDNNHHYNTHLLLDATGNICSTYRKIHLFDVDVPGGPVLKESNTTAPGAEVVVADSPAGRLGLTVCYDLRFPELYQRLRFTENCEVLLVPSAFTKTTGEAHWELLLRARAVETQCYVLAAAQAGKHNEKRESYGDAIIIDPWGKVIARLPDRLKTGLAIADIDQSVLQNVRLRMPVEQHRRYDIYGPSSCVEQHRAVPGNSSSL